MFQNIDSNTQRCSLIEMNECSWHITCLPLIYDEITKKITTENSETSTRRARDRSLWGIPEEGIPYIPSSNKKVNIGNGRFISVIATKDFLVGQNVEVEDPA